MQPVYEIGIQIIVFLQNLGDWLTPLMRFFSYLGVEEFYLFVAPAVYWCLDAGLGLRLGIGLVGSALFNSILKFAFHMPRPYWVSDKVKALSSETSFGAPSGHSQNAVVVWGIFAGFFQKPWSWIIAVLLMFFIGLSRMVLGVHFPHDVLLGWLIGALILWLFIKLEKGLLPRIKQMGSVQQTGLAFGVSLLMLALFGVVRLGVGDWQVPQNWIAQAGANTPGAEAITPLSASGVVSNAGTFFGLALGGILLYSRGWFNASGPAWKRFVRFILGILGVAIVYMGLSAIFPHGESLLPQILRYLRYALVGLWVAGLAPLLFIKLGLADKGS